MIWNEEFYQHFLAILLAFASVSLVIILISHWRYSHYRNVGQYTGAPNPVPVVAAGLVLGAGMGGFIDGIVLHQLLQWHGMLSDSLPPVTPDAKSVNMFWDGLFHLMTLSVVMLGIVLLYRAKKPLDPLNGNRIFYGNMLVGWGLFNLIEGLLNHHILELHNVRENAGNPDAYNYGFLLVSALMVLAGNSISKIDYRNSLKANK